MTLISKNNKQQGQCPCIVNNKVNAHVNFPEQMRVPENETRNRGKGIVAKFRKGQQEGGKRKQKKTGEEESDRSGIRTHDL